jgi:hypothetical protein
VKQKQHETGKGGKGFGVRGVSPVDGDEDDDENMVEEELFCICRGPSYGEMIACDYSKCKIEWFHMPCLGLNKKPTGKWYCTECTILLGYGDTRGTRSKSQTGSGSYNDMITYALNHLPRKQGVFKEITAIIEKDFTDNLNWRLET